MKFKNITVLPYDSAWPIQFQEESSTIRSVLCGAVLEIYHIGSTSVPGLSAKNELDMILVVDHLQSSLLLQKIGYVFQGELNIPLRYYFSKKTTKSHVNLHVCEKSHGFISLNLAFRDWLRVSPEDRSNYQKLKYQILQSPLAGLKVRDGLTNYGRHKDVFIKNIISKSGYQGMIINFCMHDGEYKVVKNLREKYFLDCDGSQEIFRDVFEDDKHKHFLLYKGVKIIGYAHIQLWPFQRSVLRMIIIKESYGREECIRELLRVIEPWLKLHGYQCLHIVSFSRDLAFYKNQGYEKMFLNDPGGYVYRSGDVAMGKLL